MPCLHSTTQLSDACKKRPRGAASKRGDTGRDRQGRPAVAGWALSRCARQSKRCRTTWKRIEPKVSRLFGLSKLIVPLDLLPRHALRNIFLAGALHPVSNFGSVRGGLRQKGGPRATLFSLSDSRQFPPETVRSLPGIK